MQGAYEIRPEGPGEPGKLLAMTDTVEVIALSGSDEIGRASYGEMLRIGIEMKRGGMVTSLLLVQRGGNVQTVAIAAPALTPADILMAPAIFNDTRS